MGFGLGLEPRAAPSPPGCAPCRAHRAAPCGKGWPERRRACLVRVRVRGRVRARARVRVRIGVGVGVRGRGRGKG